MLGLASLGPQYSSDPAATTLVVDVPSVVAAAAVGTVEETRAPSAPGG